MAEATFETAKTWKRILEAIQEMANEILFDWNGDGITMNQMDSSHVAVIMMELRKDGFACYRCKRGISTGVNIASMLKVLKLADDDLPLRLAADCTPEGYPPCEMELTFGNVSHPSTFTLKLMDIDMERLKVPDIGCDAIVNMV